jgi:solute:Na+ symporter, SSS family
MSSLDWTILIASLIFISIYGIYKSRNARNMETYLRGDNSLPWYAVALSVMATQASAITFLSAPGQAYVDGMRFIQFYFGLPLAMIVLCAVVVPIYHNLKVYTAYEFLEKRFDLKTRSLAAFLFLTQRGIASGLTIFAPAIILSTLLGWNIYLTNLFIGVVVIIYTVTGGTKAVSYTQLGQMAVIITGMFIAGFLVVHNLPENVSFGNAVEIAGKMGKMNVVDFDFDITNQYNVWSGIIGGFFLALSYFGTDQSQVSRYLNSKSIGQNKLGLIFNGLVKIPMQFAILFIGAILFVFYLFHPNPIHFNRVELNKIKQSDYAVEFSAIENRFNINQERINQLASNAATSLNEENTIVFNQNIDELKVLKDENRKLKDASHNIMLKNDPGANVSDVNYIFLSYVLNYLPHGIIGLLIAVIMAASMSSTSSELNALASTTIIDIYRRNFGKNKTDRHFYHASKVATVIWGIYAIIVANLAINLGSLIEAVNKLGSYFYGTILGIFLVAFFFRKIKGGTAFYAALLAEIIVILSALYTPVTFLWYNVIGAVGVVVIAHLLDLFMKKERLIS